MRRTNKSDNFQPFCSTCPDDAISAPNVPGREPGADSVATNKDGIEVSARRSSFEGKDVFPVLGIRIRIPQDTHVFGPPGSGPISQIRILRFSHKGVERTEMMLAK